MIRDLLEAGGEGQVVVVCATLRRPAFGGMCWWWAGGGLSYPAHSRNYREIFRFSRLTRVGGSGSLPLQTPLHLRAHAPLPPFCTRQKVNEEKDEEEPTQAPPLEKHWK